MNETSPSLPNWISVKARTVRAHPCRRVGVETISKPMKYKNLQVLCAIALAILIIINVLLMVLIAPSLCALVPATGVLLFGYCLFLASRDERK